jgi:hypothetical protein
MGKPCLKEPNLQREIGRAPPGKPCGATCWKQGREAHFDAQFETSGDQPLVFDVIHHPVNILHGLINIV